MTPDLVRPARRRAATPRPTRSAPPGRPRSPTSTRATAGSAPSTRPPRCSSTRTGARRTTPSCWPPRPTRTEPTTSARRRRPAGARPDRRPSRGRAGPRSLVAVAGLAARRPGGRGGQLLVAGRRPGHQPSDAGDRRRHQRGPGRGRAGDRARSCPTTTAHLDEDQTAGRGADDRRLPRRSTTSSSPGHRGQRPRDVKAMVTAEVVASGIVRSGDDRVQVLVFVNRPTTNKPRSAEPGRLQGPGRP